MTSYDSKLGVIRYAQKRGARAPYIYTEFVGLKVKTSYTCRRSKTFSSFLLCTPQVGGEGNNPKLGYSIAFVVHE